MPERSPRRRWFLRVWVIVPLALLVGPVLFLAIASTLTGAPVNAMFTDIAPPDMAEGRVWAEGGCWGDVDGDGSQELVVVNGRLPLRVWRVQADGTFVDMAPSTIRLRSQGWATSCTLVDIDEDGDLDLYITEREPALAEWQGKLLRNDGKGVFTDITEESGARMRRTGGASVDWADVDNDGDLDAFVAARWGKQRTRRNALFLQTAPLRFRDAAAARGVADPEGRPNAFLGSWFDYDADGDFDLLIAVDWWGTELYRNEGRTFSRATTQVFPAATDDTPGAPPNNPMGVTWGDYDNDGCFDVFISGVDILGQGGFETRTLTDSASRLYRGTCEGSFADATVHAGFWPTGLVQWAANFIDFDNDGDLDLSVVAGYASPELNASRAEKVLRGIIALPRRVIPANAAVWLYRHEAMIPASGQSGPEAAMPSLLFRNQLAETGKASFVDITHAVGAANVGSARGSLWADMEGDGDLDWFIPNRRTANRLFRNNGPVGNHLRVHLVGARHPQAIGAWVRIRTGRTQQLRHVHVLDGYLSQSQLDPHFGLGKAATVDELWVRWPNTTAWVRTCEAIPANRTVIVTEGAGCRW